jgi:GntR family transcriptional regulator
LDESRPIFTQIADQIENDIIAGSMPEETQVPSINEIAVFYRINPATALKGINVLVDDGVIYKKRGIGMFVANGARDRLVEKRRVQFTGDFIRPLITEAARLGITPTQLSTMLKQEGTP